MVRRDKVVTERDMDLLLSGFQGSLLPGSGVARLRPCDDNIKRWRDLQERTQVKEQSAVTCTLLLKRLNTQNINVHCVTW